MDQRPIGVFDSGLGGLTAVKVLEEMLPGEDIIYFGDTRRMPYGGRSLEEIRRLARTDAEFLRGFGVKAVLVACGTISSNAMDYLAENFDLSFFGVVEAACRRAAVLSRGKVGVIATAASIKSGAYEKCLKAMAPGLEVVSVACPGLVPLIERGHTGPDDPQAAEAVARELAPIRTAGVDTLILGCTHFPLLEGSIAAYLGGGVELVSSGAEAARELSRWLAMEGRLSERESGGERRYFTSGEPAAFDQSAEGFLGHPVRSEKHIAD